MEIVKCVRVAVQRVFFTLAEKLGAECGLIQRRRKFTAASLAQTLVFGFLAHPRATWDELAQVAATCGAAVSPQALEQRCTPKLVEFLWGLCQALVDELITAPAAAIPLLQRFQGVYLQDSTSLWLPPEYAAQWPGCGGTTGGEAGLKLQVRLDLLTGRLAAVRFEPGRDPDQKTPLQQEPLPRGALRVADLGYFCLTTLAALSAQGVYFLSRIQSSTAVFDPEGQARELLPWLSTQWQGQPLDLPVLLGRDARLACRLLAWQVPEEVAARRRQRLHDQARHKGRTPSAQRVAWCAWTIYVTNVEAERLSGLEALVLYRARWQIELLFKLWKSHGQLAARTSQVAQRQMVALLSRLMAVLLAHWLLLASVWHVPQRSLVKAVQAIQAFARSLAACLGQPQQLQQLLTTLCTALRVTARINPRKRKPNTYQLLLNPKLLDYTLT